jgi:hypothetical protein
MMMRSQVTAFDDREEKVLARDSSFTLFVFHLLSLISHSIISLLPHFHSQLSNDYSRKMLSFIVVFVFCLTIAKQ